MVRLFVSWRLCARRSDTLNALRRLADFHTAGSRNRFEGMEPVCTHTKKQKTISKRHVFLMEKYIEDVRQDEKHVPDLL